MMAATPPALDIDSTGRWVRRGTTTRAGIQVGTVTAGHMLPCCVIGLCLHPCLCTYTNRMQCHLWGTSVLSDNMMVMERVGQYVK